MSKKSKSKSKKVKNNRMLLLGVGAGVIVAALAAVIVIVFSRDNSNTDKSLSKADNSASVSSSVKENDLLIGTWKYADGTKYKFDTDGKGAMIVDKQPSGEKVNGIHSASSYEYVYHYTVDGNKLSIDYEKTEVHDAEYTFAVNGNVLHMTGGKGTAGGDYDLERVA